MTNQMAHVTSPDVSSAQLSPAQGDYDPSPEKSQRGVISQQYATAEEAKEA
jgi:hypothetical protein